MKSRDSNARKKCGLCQKLRALNHITAVPKYHQPKQFHQQSKMILNQVKQFQLFCFFFLKKPLWINSSVRFGGLLFGVFFMFIVWKESKNTMLDIKESVFDLSCPEITWLNHSAYQGSLQHTSDRLWCLHFTGSVQHLAFTLFWLGHLLNATK